MIGTFKKLNYERKLGLYFSLLTSLVLKIFSDQSFKQSKLKTSFKRCFLSNGTSTTSVLSACQMFAKCVNDPQVLEHSQKCFVRIKTAKKNYSNQSRKQSKKLKKKTATTIMKKERLIRC